MTEQSVEEEENKQAPYSIDVGFLDYDTIELLDEDFNDIVRIQRLSDATTDKLLFTALLMNVVTTAFTVGYVPYYFHYWFSVKYVVLLGYRWYSYKKTRLHYFMFDFCYFCNTLILFYLWSPWQPSGLFPVIFMFSNGPLLWAVVLWRNSLVPHSLDKMTSLFIHVSPSLTTWAIRWHSLPEQEFSLCANMTAFGPEACNQAGWWDLLLIPSIYYFIWLFFYVIVVLIWRKKHIEERNYETSVQWMTQKSKQGFVYRLSRQFGESYVKHIYFVLQSVYTLLSIFSTYFSYHWKEYNMFLFTFVVAVACYNGATFYVDVFGHNYYLQKQNNKMKNK